MTKKILEPGAQIVVLGHEVMALEKEIQALEHELSRVTSERDQFKSAVNSLQSQLSTKEFSSRTLSPGCPNCGQEVHADIKICRSCHDAWMTGSAYEFLDKVIQPIKKRHDVERKKLLAAAKSNYEHYKTIQTSNMGCEQMAFPTVDVLQIYVGSYLLETGSRKIFSFFYPQADRRLFEFGVGEPVRAQVKQQHPELAELVSGIDTSNLAEWLNEAGRKLPKFMVLERPKK